MKCGLDYVHKESWQTAVNQMIANIKTGQINKAIPLWEKLRSDLAETADAVIIACTDLNVVTDKKREHLCIVDSSACLARAVVNMYLSLSDKKEGIPE
ncbi:aspartate/glutamate racemase family protein [Brevibacillus sp. SYP-B805]|uniref:aspartate/glutamate racemase family protein n=1 Tax=Brevibacillus sp. SYP-B805 TaxID=1578199 RepID=UPI0019D30024|nr:aspartate/glutamate racemase family protein [Brevibacillus sp. SYP-B805]